MTTAQQEAIHRLARERGARVPAVTARILRDRYGYIEPHGDGWQLTPRGRAHLAGERSRANFQAVEDQLTRGDRDYAERVLAWLQAHKQIAKSDQFELRRYARHVAACDHAKVDPATPSGRWTPKARAWVEDKVRAAERCLADFDDEAKIARERGVGILVGYTADAKVPRSRSAAAKAAAQGASVVDLSTYREHRP